MAGRAAYCIADGRPENTIGWSIQGVPLARAGLAKTEKWKR